MRCFCFERVFTDAKGALGNTHTLIWPVVVKKRLWWRDWLHKLMGRRRRGNVHLLFVRGELWRVDSCFNRFANLFEMFYSLLHGLGCLIDIFKDFELEEVRVEILADVIEKVQGYRKQRWIVHISWLFIYSTKGCHELISIQVWVEYFSWKRNNGTRKKNCLTILYSTPQKNRWGAPIPRNSMHLVRWLLLQLPVPFAPLLTPPLWSVCLSVCLSGFVDKLIFADAQPPQVLLQCVGDTEIEHGRILRGRIRWYFCWWGGGGALMDYIAYTNVNPAYIKIYNNSINTYYTY